MPELPEMQALSERLDAALAGRRLVGAVPIGFSGLKTVVPAPADLVGVPVRSVGRRGKYLVVDFDGPRILVHLSQGGRLDLERPPKATRPRGSVVRLVFGAPGEDTAAPSSHDVGVLVREHGTQRKAGWWVLGAGDDGPLVTLGPEPDTAEFEAAFVDGDTGRHLHTLLRDQRFVSGVGRGYADDALHRAGLSPFASLQGTDVEARRHLVESVRAVLAEALEREREREGGLSAPRLGERFSVHNRAGEPCPRCASVLQRVSYESHEVVYCPSCQTRGKVLADRRLSRLLR